MANEIRIPIELVPIFKDLEKSISVNNKSIKKLNESVKKLNADLSAVGSPENIRSFKQLTNNVDDISKSFKGLSAESVVAALAIAKGVDISAESFKAYRRVIQNVDKSLTGFAKVTAGVNVALKSVGISLAATRESFRALIRADRPIQALSDALAKGLVANAQRAAAFLRGPLTAAFKAAGISAASLVKNIGPLRVLSEISASFVKAAKATELFEKNIFGTAVRAEVLGVALIGLGNILQTADNAIIAFSGDIIELAGFLLAPLGVTINLIIIRLGTLVKTIGDDIVAANLKAADSFVKFERASTLFNRTLAAFAKEFPNALSGVERLGDEVIELAAQFNIPIGSIKQATQVLVEVGAQAGITTEQIEQLLPILIDLAAVTKTDVVEAAQALANSLTGNSRALTRFGLIINENRVAASAFAKTFLRGGRVLSESAKVQARFNLIVEQSRPIIGSASAASETFSGIQEALQGALQKSSVEFGRGASVIENYSLGQKTLLSILQVIPDSLVNLSGFLSALAGRVIQATGVFLTFGFALVLIRSSFRALTVLFAEGVFQRFATVTIPLINKSLIQLIALAGVTNASFVSLKATIITFGTVAVVQFQKVIASLLGLEIAALSFQAVLVRTFALIIAGARAVIAAVLFSPIGAAITVVVSALIGFNAAIKAVNERSDAFTRTTSALGLVIRDISFALFGTLTPLQSFGDFLFRIGDRIVGFLAERLLTLADAALFLTKALGGRLLSNETVERIVEAQRSISIFRKELVKTGFQISKVSKQFDKFGRRGLAGGNLEESLKKINRELALLERQLEFVGVAQLQRIAAVAEKRVQIVKSALEAEIINERKAQAIIAKIRLDQEIQTAKEREKILAQSLRDQQTLIEDALRKPFEALFKGGPGGQAAAGALGADVLSGQQGALNVVATGIGAILNTFAKGLGDIVQDILKRLGEGPEKVRETIKEFIRNIPVIIENILTAIPEIIIAIVEELPRLIDAIIAAIPRIILAFIKSIPRLIRALVKAVPQLIDAIVQGVPEIIASLIKEMPKVAVELIKALVEGAGDFIEELVKAFTKLLPGGGGFLGGTEGKGPVGATGGAIGKILGAPLKFLGGLFAQGGLVPGGFPNDSFVAGLTTGEFVIDRSQNRRLDRFLDSQEGNGGQTDDPRLMDIMDAIQESSRDVTIKLVLGEREFAKAILNLNRRGFRTA